MNPPKSLIFVGVTIGAFLSLTPTVSAANCPEGIRTLARSARGEDVRQYQSFLISEGYLDADSATGFFGQLTEKAVQKWQAKNNIVSSGNPSATGYGTIGRLTRAAIAATCKKSSRTSSASPQRDILNPYVPIGTGTNHTIVEPYPAVTAKIISPNGGEEFYEGATITISYSIQGLPANLEGYTAKVYLKDSVTGDSYPIISADLIQKIGAVGTVSYDISDNLIPDTFGKNLNTYVFEIVVAKSMKREFSDSEIALAKKQKYDIATMPQPTVMTKVAVDESDSPFKIYRTTNGLLAGENDGYKSSGVITLGVSNIFDVWGERYLLRLDALTPDRADFSILSDYKPVSTFSVGFGKSTNITLPLILRAEKHILTGRISFDKLIARNVAQFNLALDGEGPRLDPTYIAATEDNLKVISIAKEFPYAVSLQYTINTTRDCSKRVYVIEFGDGTDHEVRVPDNKCSLVYQNNTIYPYKKPGAYQAVLRENYFANPGPAISEVTVVIE